MMNSKGILLPRIYTKELWQKGGSIKEHKKFIGKHYISWSQIESFNSKSGFNTGLKGEYEYIRKYFSGEQYEDMGFGTWGKIIESYICYNSVKKINNKEDKRDFDLANKILSDSDKDFLKRIKPLGNFQEEAIVYVKELDIIVLGYIDDHSGYKNNVVDTMIDYKTKSKSGVNEYLKKDKGQLEIYNIYMNQKGVDVKENKYVFIERKGGYDCMQGGGLDSLSLGRNVWIEPYKITEKRKKEKYKEIIETVVKISGLYKTYKNIIS